MPGRMRPIGSVWTTPGFCSEVMHFFHADELTAGEPALDEDERIEVRRVHAARRHGAWSLRERPTQKPCLPCFGCRAAKVNLEVTLVDSYCTRETSASSAVATDAAESVLEVSRGNT